MYHTIKHFIMLSQKVTTNIVNDEKKTIAFSKANTYRPPSSAKERLLAKMAKTKGFGVKARLQGK
jgi:hypothetical protein